MLIRCYLYYYGSKHRKTGHRTQLDQLHVISTASLSKAVNGATVKVAGLVLMRQRPGTAKGVGFMTIEDETGCANLVIFEKLFDTYRKEILQSKLIMAEGTLQVEGEVIHVIVQSCHNFSRLLRKLTSSHEEELPLLTLSRADETSIPTDVTKRAIAKASKHEKVFPGGRNFK